MKKIRAKILFVPAQSDVIFPPELSRRAAERAMTDERRGVDIGVD